MVPGAYGTEGLPSSSQGLCRGAGYHGRAGSQQHDWYGSMLSTLGDLGQEQGRLKEGLIAYDKAKAVLGRYKDGNDYGVLVNNVALCYKQLHRWNEAVACYKEAVEHRRHLSGTSHPDYATALYNLAVLFSDLKQYEEAVPRFEKVLAIYQKVFGDKHERTVLAAMDLALTRQQA
jgi:tetratricopeptide (TPR) repeat protein